MEENDFFAGFSEEAFGETKTSTSRPPELVSYNAKICYDEWFYFHADDASTDAGTDTATNDAESGRFTNDDADEMMIRKYRGDRFYLKGNYRFAIYGCFACACSVHLCSI